MTTGLLFAHFSAHFFAYFPHFSLSRVLSGEFQVVNHHLLRDLTEMGLWSNALRQSIIAHNGSIQSIPEIPADIKALYKTIWEISQRTIIDMAADRAPFIDQSQSLNIFMSNANVAKLTSMHFYGWKKGLKTGMYYLRTRAAAEAIKFTVDQGTATAQRTLTSADEEARKDSLAREKAEYEAAVLECSINNKEACVMCSG